MYCLKSFVPKLLFLICIASTFVLPKLSAQDTTETFFNRLYTEEVQPIEMELQLDLKVFLKNKNKEEYQEGKLTYIDPISKEEVSWDVELRPRGNMRRQISYIPPIKLKLSKKSLVKEGLRKYNKLKMVAQYRSGSLAEQYVIKEFHAYRMYNQISPYSFRVQLIKLKLRDLSAKKRVIDYWGFLIEPEEEFAQRMGGVMVEREKVRTSFLVEKEFHRMSLFQYMIGNTDWSVGNSHNLKLIKVPEFSRLVPVPYDFDYAGLVNAVYATPFHTLPIKRVTDRLYRGNTFSKADIEEIVPQFKDKASDIIQIIETCAYLDPRNRKFALNYLRDFFKECKRHKGMGYVLQKRGY